MDLRNLIKGSSYEQQQYSSKQFRRSVRNVEVGGHEVSLISDELLEYSIEHFTCSVSLSNIDSKTLLIEGFSPVEDNYGFINSGQNRDLWIPTSPTVRIYGDTKHITTERSTTVGITENGIEVNLPDPDLGDSQIEFSIVSVRSDSTVISSLSTESLVESCPVIKARWFDYNNITSFWDYFINGTIYDPRTKGTGRWQCQQCAHSLYLHLLYIGNASGNQLYNALAELVAYSVAISLPDDGQWRHGVWTDEDETHARFQTDGVNLLITAYEKTGQQLFLDKASNGMDYLISISDTLSNDEIWFSHDSLEQSEDLHSKHYEFRPKTTVLGKATSNTLCLNTHAWTMVALKRLTDIAGIEEYANIFERSKAALHRVLSLRQASSLYGVGNFIFDSIAYSNWAPDPLLYLNTRASQAYLMPLKSVFPRIVMPSGRIERDISHTVRSDFYHLQNLKDLLVINTYLQDDQIIDIVLKGISYTNDRNIVFNMVPEDRRAVIILDVLVLAMAQSNKDLTNELETYKSLFVDNNLPLSADVVSFGPTLAPSVRSEYEKLKRNYFPEIGSERPTDSV